MRNALQNIPIRAWSKARAIWQHSDLVACLLVSTLFLVAGTSTDALAGTYGEVCTKVIGMASGEFGSLLCAVCGLGAICASAMGGFKMAWALVVVALGSYLLNTYVGLFFTQC